MDLTDLTLPFPCSSLLPRISPRQPQFVISVRIRSPLGSFSSILAAPQGSGSFSHPLPPGSWTRAEQMLQGFGAEPRDTWAGRRGLLKGIFSWNPRIPEVGKSLQDHQFQPGTSPGHSDQGPVVLWTPPGMAPPNRPHFNAENSFF